MWSKLVVDFSSSWTASHNQHENRQMQLTSEPPPLNGVLVFVCKGTRVCECLGLFIAAPSAVPATSIEMSVSPLPPICFTTCDWCSLCTYIFFSRVFASRGVTKQTAHSSAEAKPSASHHPSPRTMNPINICAQKTPKTEVEQEEERNGEVKHFRSNMYMFFVGKCM